MSGKSANSNGRSELSVQSGPAKIVYCNCSYARVVPAETKNEVLSKLCASGVAFDSVADLCEMSARKDPALDRIAGGGNVKIAACFPRAVKWLFHAAGAPLPENGVDVLNMREQSADEIVPLLLNGVTIKEASA
jgi:hypothetical protein